MSRIIAAGEYYNIIITFFSSLPSQVQAAWLQRENMSTVRSP